MQSKDDQKKNEKNDATDCTSKNVSNALICCAKNVGDIENDDFKDDVRGAVDTKDACDIENDGIETVENAIFGVQSMKVDVESIKIKNDNAVVSWFEISDRRSMIDDENRIEVLLLNSSMWEF